MDRHPLIGNAVLLDRRINLDVLNKLGNHALGDGGGVGVAAHRFQESIHIHLLIFQLFQLQPQGLDPSGVLALLLLIPLGHFGKPGIVDLAGHIVLIEPLKEHIQLSISGQQPVQLSLLAYPVIFRYLGRATHHRLDEVIFVFVSEAGKPVYLVEHHLLQKVQPDIVGRRAFAEAGIVVVAAKELDVVVILVKVESQVAAALRAFQIAAKGAKITLLPLSELHDFPNHPFKVRDDEAMQETAESIRQYGVLVPAIVRPREDGGYEIIAGHRRRHGSELAGLSAMPCIVREMDDDTATILMVDSNIQRENILPSERAQAYKMKLEAIRRKAGRPAKEAENLPEENCDQVGHNFDRKRSVEIVADEAGESKSQVQRYIRLTELSPELQQMVDEKKIGMTPAVEISYLKPEEQQMLLTAIDSEQATPSLSQAQRMKKLSRDGKLNDDTMLDIMMEQKKPEGYNVVLSADKLRKYFPRSYTPQKMEETILKLLDAWLRKRQRDQSR